jgi:hypothetical protein
MSGISTVLDLKAFQSLLKGLVHIVYYHDPLKSSANDITREDLVAKVYGNSDLDVNDKKNEIEIFENVSYILDFWLVVVITAVTDPSKSWV